MANAGEVALPEQREVNEERVKLVGVAAALRVPGGERGRSEIGIEAQSREPAEELHHREVHLTMPAIGRGIQEDRIPRLVPEDIPAPEVAVEEGKAVVLPPLEREVDVGEHLLGSRPRLSIEAVLEPGEEGKEPGIPPKCRPFLPRTVPLRQPSDPPVLLPPWRSLRERSMEGGESLSQPLGNRAPGSPGTDELEKEPTRGATFPRTKTQDPRDPHPTPFCEGE